MAASHEHQDSPYAWHDCDDFQLPDNSVWFGKDDDGSDVFCGKAWNDGQEVPAKIIPEKRECRIVCDGGEKIVPECRKVLINRRPSDCHCHKRRPCHCDHRRRPPHCHCEGRRDRDDCRCSSNSESESEESSETREEQQSSSHHEHRAFVKSVKSNSTTTIIKKEKKKHKGGSSRGGCGGGCSEKCWYETRTREVPRVTYEPRVIMERRVRLEPETYTVIVCSKCNCDCDRRGPCHCNRRGSCECDRSRRSSCEPIQRRDRHCREALICERPPSRCENKEERCVRPEKCSSPPSPPVKGKCW